jgi:hypothetical protein
MGLELIAGIAAATAAVGTANQLEQGRVARSTARTQAGLQRQRQGEERAMNAAQAAQERRQQIREERVRRARVMQASENTGVAGSSGEIGAIGALSTGLSSNIGTNLGRLGAAERLSGISQGIADTNLSLGLAQSRAQEGQALTNIGSTIFGAAGGFGTLSGSSIFSPTPSLGGGGGYVPIAGE